MYNILIVDDEKIERNGIKFLLNRIGLQLNVSEASNGREAMEYILKLREGKEQIDILLTDVKMPFMDGIELIRTAQESGLNMKNIIFSGYNEFEYAKLAVKLGVVDYILKPVNPKEFEETITKVISELDEARAEQENIIKRDGFMKEYLLYSLVNGVNVNGVQPKDAAVDEAHKSEYLRIQAENMVGSDFWNKYDRILLLEFNSDMFGKEIMDFEIEILNDVENISEYQYLNLNQQQAILMVHDSDNPVEIAKNIHEVIIEKIGHQCYASISGLLTDYADISRAVEHLDELMQNKFYHPEVYIYTDEKDCEQPGLVQIDDDTLMKQMRQDIRMKDIEGLKQHFDRLSKKYKNQSYFSHIYIKFIFSNLLKELYEGASGGNEDEFNKEIEKLYTSDDLDSIIDIINDHIVKLEKTFERNPQMAHREIETVKQYIYGHYGEEIGVDQLAEMVYLTPSYLSTVFKKETGQNLSKFIKQYRMEQAKDMLENTNKKIVNISNETGYPNVSYFCQSFREYYGVSPQKFRDQGSKP